MRPARPGATRGRASRTHPGGPPSPAPPADPRPAGRLITPAEVEELERAVRSVTTRHGTQLAYHEYGDPAGRPIIFFHNSGSHVCAMLLHGPAAARGFRIIVPDRPGTGRSGFIPGWSALGFARVVADLADVLGLGTFGAMGLSGGGPTLMAAAFSMPERLEFVVDLACAMPLYGDADERAQLGAADRLYARLGAGLPLPLFQAPFSVIGLSQRLLRSPRSFARLFASSLCPADKALFAIPELQYVIMRDFQEFFRQGSRAAAYDAQVVYKDWGFALADVATLVEVYQGADDRFVPPRFSEYLARTAPDVRLTLLEGEGHFCHLADADTTLARVAELASAGPDTTDVPFPLSRS